MNKIDSLREVSHTMSQLRAYTVLHSSSIKMTEPSLFTVLDVAWWDYRGLEYQHFWSVHFPFNALPGRVIVFFQCLQNSRLNNFKDTHRSGRNLNHYVKTRQKDKKKKNVVALHVRVTWFLERVVLVLELEPSSPLIHQMNCDPFSAVDTGCQRLPIQSVAVHC